MSKTYLVTGAAGFIGSNFVRLILREAADARVIAYDALTYAGNLQNLDDMRGDSRFQFVHGDICDPDPLRAILSRGVDYVVNFAAESHVDRSIAGARDFVHTNVEGTRVLLDASHECGVGRFIQISTDEVYGSLGPTGRFHESMPLSPRSPYSASKAGADLLALAFHHTHGVPVSITRCSNNYGPYQYPEKLIPLFITNLLEGRRVPLYGDGRNVRDWIHVEDHCRAILAVMERGEVGEVYNVGADNELANIEITHRILEQLRLDDSVIEYVTDRLGHDRRYAVDASKLREELGWRPQVDFETGIAQTIDWYCRHSDWWKPLKHPGRRSEPPARCEVVHAP